MYKVEVVHNKSYEKLYRETLSNHLHYNASDEYNVDHWSVFYY